MFSEGYNHHRFYPKKFTFVLLFLTSFCFIKLNFCFNLNSDSFLSVFPIFIHFFPNCFLIFSKFFFFKPSHILFFSQWSYSARKLVQGKNLLDPNFFDLKLTLLMHLLSFVSFYFPIKSRQNLLFYFSLLYPKRTQ